VAGDFNAKHLMWCSRQNNTAGQSLLTHYYKNNYVISAPSQPTYFPDLHSLGADILDIAILSNVLTKHSIRTLGNLSTSDHRPVLLSFNCPFEPAETKPTFTYSAANLTLFQSYIVSHLNTHCLVGNCLVGNCSISGIDVAIKHLSVTIISAARHAIPLKSSSFSTLQIASSTLALIQKRNRLRSLWQRTHDFSLRPLINSLKYQIDSTIKQQVSYT
jgi:hypothetical protein